MGIEGTHHVKNLICAGCDNVKDVGHPPLDKQLSSLVHSVSPTDYFNLCSYCRKNVMGCSTSCTENQLQLCTSTHGRIMST